MILSGIYAWNIIVLGFFFFGWLFIFKMLTLKSPIMMIGQCSRVYWIIVWRLFKNVKLEHEWALYTHTIYIVFRVLVLKVVTIYYEPSLIIVLKESKCMCHTYIIINPWPSLGHSQVVGWLCMSGWLLQCHWILGNKPSC